MDANTVNQLIFVAFNFGVFVFMSIFAVIYFRRLQSCILQEQCHSMSICTFSWRFILANFFLSHENKSLAKIN